MEKSEYAQAYALVPDPGPGGNVPYPLLVCKGLAAQGMGGKTEVSLRDKERRGRKGKKEDLSKRRGQGEAIVDVPTY